MYMYIHVCLICVCVVLRVLCVFVCACVVFMYHVCVCLCVCVLIGRAKVHVGSVVLETLQEQKSTMCTCKPRNVGEQEKPIDVQIMFGKSCIALLFHVSLSVSWYINYATPQRHM